MSHYLEEQTNELEALKSIFFDEFIEPEVQTEPASFRLRVETEEGAGYPSVRMQLCVQYTKEYPDSLPLLEIREAEGVEEEEVDRLVWKLQEYGESQKGMAMVFGLHSYLKEQVEEYVRGVEEEKERERERKMEALLEEERRQASVKKVTRESFEEWRRGFEEERRRLEGLDRGSILVGKKEGRKTGRELFEGDRSLVESDVLLVSVEEEVVDSTQFSRDSTEMVSMEEEDEVNLVVASFSFSSLED